MKRHKILFALCSLFLLASCSVIDIEDSTLSGSLRGEIATPVQGNGVVGETKAIAPDFSFYWVVGEKMAVYTGEPGEMMIYSVKSASGSSCVFNVQKFGLLDGLYYSISPSQGDNNDPEAIPLTLVGQAQSANNNTNHLTKYDYKTSSAVITGNAGSFSYSHLVAWVKFVITTPVAATFKSIKITAGGEYSFATAGTVSLLTDELTTTASAHEVTLTLSDISVEAGQPLTAFYTFFPEDLSTDGLILTISYEDEFGRVRESVKTFTPKTSWVRGKYYTYKFKMPVDAEGSHESYGDPVEGSWGDNTHEKLDEEAGDWGPQNGSEGYGSENGSWGDNSHDGLDDESGNW